MIDGGAAFADGSGFPIAARQNLVGTSPSFSSASGLRASAIGLTLACSGDAVRLSGNPCSWPVGWDVVFDVGTLTCIGLLHPERPHLYADYHLWRFFAAGWVELWRKSDGTKASWLIGMFLPRDGRNLALFTKDDRRLFFSLYICEITNVLRRAKTLTVEAEIMKHGLFKFRDALGHFGQGQNDGIQPGSVSIEVTSVTVPKTSVTDVTYSDEVVAELLYMIEEEKLARDVYEAFQEMYGLSVFENIAASEDKHFVALIGQAQSLGIDTDQFVFAEAGSFENPELQELYETLIETGSTSLTSALEVGSTIEKKDISDIAAAMDDVEGSTLARVYANLLAGSESHLVAFDGLLG